MRWLINARRRIGKHRRPIHHLPLRKHQSRRGRRSHDVVGYVDL